MTKKAGSRNFYRHIDKLGFLVALAAMAATAYQGYIARESMRQGLRAYVGTEGASWMEESQQPGQPKTITSGVVVTFQNRGTTPAYHVNTNVSYTFSTTALTNDFRYPENYDESNGPRSAGMLAPNVPMKSIVSLASPPDLIALYKGETGAYVYGHVSYDDIFGMRHTTTYCYTLKAPLNVFHMCPNHNEQYDGDYIP